MPLNPPRLVRVALYLLTALGTPVVAYLNSKGILGATEVTLWSAEVAVVGGMAALNTGNAPEPETATVTAPADVEVRTKRRGDRGAANALYAIWCVVGLLVILALLVWLGVVHLG